ncbi:MAG: ComEA family DNA-binding protein [Bacillota bacterium]|nr:ComEA family DNA-binding protein [Bacillota bacterium]
MNKILSREFLAAHKEQLIKAIAVIVVIAVAFFVFTGKGGDEDDAAAVSGEPGQTEAVQEQGEEGNYSPDSESEGSAAQTSGKILVDVSGAVNYPKVVELPRGSRVQDAIDAAGGLKKRADISGINRAAEVQDGEKIDIPFRSRNGASSGDAYSSRDQSYGQSSSDAYSNPSSASSADAAGGMVNINTAGSEQLQTLTGIGPALAERIISYREQNGAFMSIEEIKNVSGIGDKTFEKFKDRITT